MLIATYSAGDQCTYIACLCSLVGCDCAVSAENVTVGRHEGSSTKPLVLYCSNKKRIHEMIIFHSLCDWCAISPQSVSLSKQNKKHTGKQAIAAKSYN